MSLHAGWGLGSGVAGFDIYLQLPLPAAVRSGASHLVRPRLLPRSHTWTNNSRHSRVAVGLRKGERVERSARRPGVRPTLDTVAVVITLQFRHLSDCFI